MDIIIIGFIISTALVAINLASNLILMTRMARLEVSHKKFDEKLIKLEYKTAHAEDRLRRLELASENNEAATPIKPNNWDSLKLIFKKPVRVDRDESN